MHRYLAILTLGLLTAILSGCQLLGALLPDGAGGLPMAGTCATYQVVATEDRAATPEILEQTRTIIANRVNATGVAEPVVVTQGEDRISVDLTGLEAESDFGSVRSLIGTTGVLEFTPVPPACASEVLQGARLPACMLGVEPIFDGTEIAAARVEQDQTTSEIVVNLELKDNGARLFDEHAADHFGEQFAIVLDGIVESAPSINARRFGGQAQISGDFTIEQATNLIAVMRYGPLPLEIREVGFGACEPLGSS